VIHETAIIESGSVVSKTAEIGPWTYVGHNAYVSDEARLTGCTVEGIVGAHTVVWRMAHVMDGGVVGRDCMLGQNVLVADDAVIGDRVRVQNNTCISRKVVIDDDCYIGAGVMFCNAKYPSPGGCDELYPITVGSGVSIGSNVCIIGLIDIGEGAVIGAGAVVTSHVDAGTTVVGNPARVLHG